MCINWFRSASSSLSKNLPCLQKVGISSQQINYFVSVLTLIKSFARRTHIHACTPTYVYRDIHTFMHTFMNSCIKTSPPIITSTTDTGENDIHSFIQSGYFYSASLSPLLLRGAPDHSN